MKIHSARVKFAAGKIFSGKYGDRQSIKLELENGDEVDVWFDAGHQDYCSLRKGAYIQVVQNGDKFTAAFDDSDEPPALPPSHTPAMAAPPSAGMSEDEKAALFQDICLRAKVIRTCHIQIHSLFLDEEGRCTISDELIQRYATSLYIDISRKIR